MDEELEELLDIKAAADYFKLHPMTIRRFIKEKKINCFFKIGNSWRTKKSLIQEEIKKSLEEANDLSPLRS